jgi:hypothetical protein
MTIPPFIPDTQGAEEAGWDYDEGTDRDPRLRRIAYAALACFTVAVWIAAGAGVYWQGVHWGFWE